VFRQYKEQVWGTSFNKTQLLSKKLSFVDCFRFGSKTIFFGIIVEGNDESDDDDDDNSNRDSDAMYGDAIMGYEVKVRQLQTHKKVSTLVTFSSFEH